MFLNLITVLRFHANKKNRSRQVVMKSCFVFLLCLLLSNTGIAQNSIDLSGTWQFQTDSLNIGLQQKWYNQKLQNQIKLPGSMATNGIGNPVDLKTPSTGDILDSSYYKKPQYAPYRKPGNIKIPFWLQPVKYYKGVAWYQKTVNVPKSFEGKAVCVYLERPHWQSTVWVDGQKLGEDNSLGTAHTLNISKLKAGEHTITVRIDNGINELKVGEDSHSISDNTQGNWNGIIGKMALIAMPQIHIENVQLYPDIAKKQVLVNIKFNNPNKKAQKSILEIEVQLSNPKAEKLNTLSQKISIAANSDSVSLDCPMGQNPLLWDEFNPNVYTMKVRLKSKSGADEKAVDFGMREIAAQGKQLTINGKPLFLRGTLDCAAYPLTGFPPMDVASWTAILTKIKSYGLNHVRYHSWAPPEAAFIAADKLGMYLQVECSSWANGDARIGEGKVLDKWI